MRKIFCILTLFFFPLSFVHAQEAPAAQLSHKIANKVADSLNLNNQQRAKIFGINMELSRKKTEARKKSADRVAVGKDLQQIEGSRDAMYKEILTQEQYTLYLQKKRNLVNNIFVFRYKKQRYLIWLC